MEILTQVHEKTLVEWAKDKSEVVVLSGDLTGSTEITAFKNTYPERFYSMGLSEQNMVSYAGGWQEKDILHLYTHLQCLCIDGHMIKSPCL